MRWLDREGERKARIGDDLKERRLLEEIVGKRGKGITVLSLKIAPGAFEIENIIELFDPLKSAPSHFILMIFLMFS